MNRATVRIELHYATENDYETLHQKMRQKGFSRIITTNEKVSYILPRGEYNYVGNKNQEEIFSLAQDAANATKRANAILVTMSVSRRWDGLQKASTSDIDAEK